MFAHLFLFALLGSTFAASPCPKGCLDCKSTAPAACLLCDVNYLPTSKKTCKKCPIKNCNECKSPKLCKKCNAGFLLSADGKSCKACSAVINGCGEVCGGTIKTPTCSICQDNYGWIEEGRKCTKCFENCLQCQNNQTCLYCRAGFALAADKKSCVQCSENCDRCKNTTECERVSLKLLISPLKVLSLARYFL